LKHRVPRRISRQKSFTAWIKAINARKAEFSAQDYLASIASGLAEAAGFGTTTLANLEAFPELLTRDAAATAEDVVVAEMIDVREPQSAVVASEQCDQFRTNEMAGGIGWPPRAFHRSATPTPKLLGSRRVPICC
jgi:hypothetical protein